VDAVGAGDAGHTLETIGTSLDTLRAAVGRMLAADRRLRGHDQRRRGELSHAHVRALFVLMREREATAGMLARVAGLNPATVTGMVDHLERLGLVERRRDDQDRRVCYLSLTDAGRDQVAAKEQRWHETLRSAFSDVSDDDILVAAQVIQRLADVFEQLRSAEPPVTGADPPDRDPPDIGRIGTG
jgi:DNA-binding MarR family transcriptional regulator